MFNKTLIEYIKSSRKAGVQEYFIRQALLEKGWSDEDVDEALDSEAAWLPESRVDFTSKATPQGQIKKRGWAAILKEMNRPTARFILISILAIIASLLGWWVLGH